MSFGGQDEFRMQYLMNPNTKKAINLRSENSQGGSSGSAGMTTSPSPENI